MQIAIVKYQVATYSGEISVNCDEDDEDSFIKAKAKKMLSNKAGPLPFGYQGFYIVERRNI